MQVVCRSIPLTGRPVEALGPGANPRAASAPASSRRRDARQVDNRIVLAARRAGNRESRNGWPARGGGARPQCRRPCTGSPARASEFIRGTVKRCSLTGWLTARPGAGWRVLLGRGRSHRLPRTILPRGSAAGRAGGGRPRAGRGRRARGRRVRAGTATTSRETAGALRCASRPDAQSCPAGQLSGRALTPALSQGARGRDEEDALVPPPRPEGEGEGRGAGPHPPAPLS